eukprot:6895730-Pyramimonas_sp.AAC.1
MPDGPAGGAPVRSRSPQEARGDRVRGGRGAGGSGEGCAADSLAGAGDPWAAAAGANSRRVPAAAEATSGTATPPATTGTSSHPFAQADLDDYFEAYKREVAATIDAKFNSIRGAVVKDVTDHTEGLVRAVAARQEK